MSVKFFKPPKRVFKKLDKEIVRVVLPKNSFEKKDSDTLSAPIAIVCESLVKLDFIGLSTLKNVPKSSFDGNRVKMLIDLYNSLIDVNVLQKNSFTEFTWDYTVCKFCKCGVIRRYNADDVKFWIHCDLRTRLSKRYRMLYNISSWKNT